MLLRNLKVVQIFGANTDVGKTIFSTILGRALNKRATSPDSVLYVKPVSTGPDSDADDLHIEKFASGILARTISQFRDPVSPHKAALEFLGREDIMTSDSDIVRACQCALSDFSGSGGQYALLETAGGVLSPGPSGTLQADLYRPLRLPIVLVGDAKLGGIATTISAFESLTVRGYDVDSVVLFDDPTWGNGPFLRDHFARHDIPTYSIKPPPPRQECDADDHRALESYYGDISDSSVVSDVVNRLEKQHLRRLFDLEQLPVQTQATIWHPFRQHGHSQRIISIDSAYGDYFEAATGEFSFDSVTRPLFDGSASWWTQGLGHGNAHLAMKAAYAAGRYGHVMFAHAAHQPALDISKGLLSAVNNSRLSRTFFTDNGSTAMEVAVKMALRSSSKRYNWDKDAEDVGILGLAGSYHGDTIGVMNCSETNIFNEKVDWHKPWGYWFDPPQFHLSDGVWNLSVPGGMCDGDIPLTYDDLTSVFDYAGRTPTALVYEKHIRKKLDELVVGQKRRFGALILEPLLMGAGGMILVDPLFQRTLIKVVRENPSLIQDGATVPENAADWSGVPVVADEVFTGLYRLGRPSATSWWSADPFSGEQDIDVSPDISAHAKLLTGGVVPLSITAASECIFNTFLSEHTEDALLHGHSYTAHAVGCTVGVEALKIMSDLHNGPAWSGYKRSWSESEHGPVRGPVFSFYSPGFLCALSKHERVAGCFAIGTVLAVKLKSSETGYASVASKSIQQTLLRSTHSNLYPAVHSRVLGDVIYLMTSLTTTPAVVAGLEQALLDALDVPDSSDV